MHTNEPVPWLRTDRPEPCAPPKPHCAPMCDDQLPIISRVGRGIKGDSVDAWLEERDGHTYLHVKVTDDNGNQVGEEYVRPVDGGKLTYGYNLHPFNDPSTFTITFHYDHPSEDPDLDWSWTTPEIPYMWTNEGASEIVGSGIASLFIRKKGESWRRTVLDNPLPTSHTWAEAVTRQEKLIYPVGDTVAEDRYYYNAPDPDDPEKKWTVNLTYGISTERYPTDIDVPNREDLSKILGISTDNIEELTNFYITPIDELPVGMNLKQYIDAMQDQIDNLKAIIGDLVSHIYNTTVPDWTDDTPAITWGTGWNDPDTGDPIAYMPEADLNVFSGTATPTDAKYADAIRSRSLSNNDITFQ